LPGPRQLIEYSAVAAKRADVMREALAFQAIEMRSGTMLVDHFGELVWRRNAGRVRAVLEQEDVHIRTGLGLIEVGVQSLQRRLHRKVDPERNSCMINISCQPLAVALQIMINTAPRRRLQSLALWPLLHRCRTGSSAYACTASPGTTSTRAMSGA
jgi:hypothetical protein